MDQHKNEMIGKLITTEDVVLRTLFATKYFKSATTAVLFEITVFGNPIRLNGEIEMITLHL